MYGEGNYGLSVIKEVKVKEDFLALDKTVTDCQMESSVADCSSQLYLTALLSSCGCVPLSLSSVYRSHPVSISWVRPVSGCMEADDLANISVQVCLPSSLNCVAAVRTDPRQCVTPCQGIIADVKKILNSGPKVDKNLKTFLQEYENYKRRDTDDVKKLGTRPGTTKCQFPKLI